MLQPYSKPQRESATLSTPSVPHLNPSNLMMLTPPRAYRRCQRSRTLSTCFKRTRKRWISSQEYTTNTRNISTKPNSPTISSGFGRMFAVDVSTFHTSSLLLCSKIDEYHKWLVKADDGKPHRKVPILKAVWKAGDLKPKLEAWNRDISRIHRHWQVRNGLLLRTVVHHPCRIKSTSGRSHSCKVRGRKC